MSNKLRYALPVEQLSKINLLCKQMSSRIKEKKFLLGVIVWVLSVCFHLFTNFYDLIESR